MIQDKKLHFLIVDDDKEIVQTISKYFSQYNTTCVKAYNLNTGKKYLNEDKFDFILLDLNLPDGNGRELISYAQELNFNGNIIILSGNNSLEDKITCLNTGSDDYISKPFSLEILTSRIKNLYRSKTNNRLNAVQFHELIIYTDSHRVFVNNNELKLTSTEFELLLFLINNAKKILTRETIARYLYKNKYYIEESFDFIYSHIKNLKKKISQFSKKEYLKTVYGIGYTISFE